MKQIPSGRPWRRGGCMALLVAGVLASGAATADLSASFTPAIVQLGAAARLDYTIAADSDDARRGLAFSAELPAGLALADPALNRISCPGFVDAPAGGDTLVVSEVSLATGQSCQISVHVEALAAGNHSVTSSELSGAGAPDPPATAELQVVADQALLGISYSQASARWGDRLRLSYELDNTAGTVFFNASLGDTLPSGWTIHDPVNLANSCGGSVSAGPGQRQITGAGMFVASGTSCNVALDVVAGSVGRQSHAAFLGGANQGYALAAVEVVADAVHLTQNFSAIALPGATVEVRYRIANTTGLAASNLAFSHDLEAVLSGLTVTDTPRTGICGAGSSVSGGSTLSFSGGSLAEGEACEFELTLQIPAAAAASSYVSATGILSGTHAGVAYSGSGAATATLEVSHQPLLEKEIDRQVAANGDTLTTLYTLSNSSADDSLQDFVFTDSYASITTQAPTVLAAAGSCGAGSSFGVVSVLGVWEVRGNGLSLAAGGQCSFEVSWVLASTAGLAGSRITSSAGTVAGEPVTVREETASVLVLPTPQTQLSLSPETVTAGTDTVLRVAVGGDLGGRRDAAAGLSSLSWDLDLGDAPVEVLGALPRPGVCGSDSSLTLHADVLSLTNAVIPEGGRCELALDLRLAALAEAGTYSLSLRDIFAAAEATEVTGRERQVDLVVDGLALELRFSSLPAAPGEPLEIDFILENPGTVTTISDISLVTDLADGIPGVIVTGVSSGDAACLAINNPGGSQVVVDIAELAAGASCTGTASIELPPGIAAGDYPVRASVQARYGAGALQPVAAAPRYLAVVEPGTPRDVTPLALSEPDPDGDSIATAVEHSIGDGNLDGIPDALQDNVASLLSVDGEPLSTAVSGAVVISAMQSLPAPADGPPGIEFPFGLVSFVLSNVPAESTQQVQVYLPHEPAINSYWKQNRAGEWVNIASSVAHLADQNRTLITLTLVEDGPLDIESPNNPSTITDPGGPGIIPPAQSIPVLAPGLVLLLAGLLAAVGFSYRRRSAAHPE